MNRPAIAPAPVDYSSSDGQPMAESDFQLIASFHSFVGTAVATTQHPHSSTEPSRPSGALNPTGAEVAH